MVIATSLSEAQHFRYSASKPNYPPDFEDFDASDFDPPPHLMSPEDPAEYDAWLRANVEAVIANPGRAIPHSVVMKEMLAIIDRHRTTS